MKYFLIAGEASGDLHASNLMRALQQQDPDAQFRYYGGDLMQAAAGSRGLHLCHYKDIAYMGFIPVLMHARTILKAMRRCRQAVLQWQPDALILVDYPGFNLKIAKYVRRHSSIPTYYYISPKIWAWKEHRIQAIKRDVDQMISILPFEVDFYRKHTYPIHYVGNPSVDEIAEWKSQYTDDHQTFLSKHHLPDKPIIALLPGSRRQEIKDNLTRMLEAAAPYRQRGYQLVIAGAPNIDDNFYQGLREKGEAVILRNSTFALLANAEAALVTSGTATLETALLRVPQVVCYYTSWGLLVSLLRKHLLKVKYISLVNLIVDRELVPELVADQMTVSNIARHLSTIVSGGTVRQQQLQGYEEMARRLGEAGAPQRAAHIICRQLKER